MAGISKLMIGTEAPDSSINPSHLPSCPFSLFKCSSEYESSSALTTKPEKAINEAVIPERHH